MCQMFTTGKRFGLQAGQFNTWTLTAAVCCLVLPFCNIQGLPWKHIVWMESCGFCETHVYLSALMVPLQMCKLPIWQASMSNLLLFIIFISIKFYMFSVQTFDINSNVNKIWIYKVCKWLRSVFIYILHRMPTVFGTELVKDHTCS